MLKTQDRKYLRAELGQSLFIQIRLLINSGFVPKLSSRKKDMCENCESSHSAQFSRLVQGI